MWPRAEKRGGHSDVVVSSAFARKGRVLLLRQPEVLIIDGNRDALAKMAQHFQNFAFAVMVALNARAGVRQARDGLPDLIVIEAQTPGGLLAIEQLRRETSTAHIPIVILLTSPDTFQQRQWLAAGATDWLLTPSHTASLIALALTHIRIHRRLSGTVPWERSAALQRLTQMVVVLQEAQSLGPVALQAAVASVEADDGAAAMEAHIGLTAAHFAQQLQMALACERLRSSALGQLAIAQGAGYADLVSFTQAFTQRFGLAPAEFRLVPHSPQF